MFWSSFDKVGKISYDLYMSSNKLSESLRNENPTYIDELKSKSKYYELTQSEFVALKQEMKDTINAELSLIFAKACNFEQALEDIKSSKALSDLYELYISQLELAQKEKDYREYDRDFNPDMNSVPTILSNLRRAIFAEIDAVQLNYKLTPSIFKLKTQRLVSYCEQYEKTFPTVVEILQQLRFESNPNDFELYKSEMIKHIADRLGLKIALGLKLESVSDLDTFKQEAKINKEFRVFLSRIDLSKLRSSGASYLEELMSILESSFSVRDVANMYRADQQAIRYNINPENTPSLIQFYREGQMSTVILDELLVEVAKIINAIPYRDSIHNLRPIKILQSGETI